MSTVPIIPSAYMVETFTGRFVDTKTPDHRDVCLEDIAHALANTCRFGGHCSQFYSVAEHAVLVSKRLEQKGGSLPLLFGGLHHDDAEAYLGDIPRPMKGLLGSAYKRMTARMDLAIFRGVLNGAVKGFTVDDIHREPVKTADNWALILEARFLLPSRGLNWTASQKDEWGVALEDSRRVRTPDYWTGGLEPGSAEQLYLTRHKELINA